VYNLAFSHIELEDHIEGGSRSGMNDSKELTYHFTILAGVSEMNV
jgi:hypothetical protein